MKKLIALNFGGIGDQILFLPLLHSIKEKYPESEITLVVEPRSRMVDALSHDIDIIKTSDIKSDESQFKKFFHLYRILKSEKYDAVVSCGASPLVSVLLFLSGIKNRIGFATNKLSRMLLTYPIKLNKKQYAAFMFQDLSVGFGLKNLYALPEIILPGEALSWLANWQQNHPTHGKKMVVIHPGSSKLSVKKGILKNWPVESWVAVIKHLLSFHEIAVVLAGGPDDDEIIHQILDQVGGHSGLINSYGETKNLYQLGALIQASSLFVGIDSGPMHMAIGLGKKIVAIFGPTDEKKVVPEDSRFHTVRIILDCTPCLFDKSMKVCDDPKCLAVPAYAVIEAVDAALRDEECDSTLIG